MANLSNNLGAGNFSRPGSDNGAVDKKGLFIEIFAGQVLNMFNMATVTMGRHLVRNISEGKQANFPVTGGATSGYHTPGNAVDFKSITHSEKVIAIRDLLVAATFISNYEEKMNHFEVRSEYAKQLGQALAEEMDGAVLRNMVLAARSTSNITQAPKSKSGSIITAANANDISGDVGKLVTAFYSAAQRLDENNAPSQGRQAFIKPLEYYALFRSSGTTAVSDMVNRDLGGDGSVAEARMPKIAGIEVVKTNNMPKEDESGETGLQQAALALDYEKTVCVINTPEAVGTVKLMDLAVESEYAIANQGHQMVARLAAGHGVLRPECSIEVSDAGKIAAEGFNTDDNDDVEEIS